MTLAKGVKTNRNYAKYLAPPEISSIAQELWGTEDISPERIRQISGDISRHLTLLERIDLAHVGCIFLCRKLNRSNELSQLPPLERERDSILKEEELLLRELESLPEGVLNTSTYSSLKHTLWKDADRIKRLFKSISLRLTEEARRLAKEESEEELPQSFALRLARSIISDCIRANKEASLRESPLTPSINSKHAAPRFEAPPIPQSAEDFLAEEEEKFQA